MPAGKDVLTVATTREEVEAGILALDQSLRNFSALPPREAADVKQALPRARSWVAVYRNGQWVVGFSKYVGHRQVNGDPLNPKLYAKHRHDISGTDSERAIKRLPGQAFPVGWMAEGSTGSPEHPAAQAVERLCQRFGKQPNSRSEVYVLQGEDVPFEDRSKVAILVAAAKAAELSPKGRAYLLERIAAL
jgi:hypothetical protein